MVVARMIAYAAIDTVTCPVKNKVAALATTAPADTNQPMIAATTRPKPLNASVRISCTK
jgi:hypothetical protein